MPRVSELYQAEHTWGDYDSLAYNWGNAQHPSTYQSFALSGKGLIDQSIFMFQRKKDAWSIGAYCTSVSWSGDLYHPTLTVTKNKLSKNNVMLSAQMWQGAITGSASQNLYFSSNAYVENYEYSPVPSSSGLQSLSPWIDIPYNRFCLLPKFGLINPANGATVGGQTYNDVVNNGRSGWRISHLSIERYNAGQGNTVNPCTVQFAGRINKLTMDSNKLKIADAAEEGVFYIPLDCGYILNMYATTGDTQAHVNPTGCTNTVFFDLSQMDFQVTRRNDNVYVSTISFDDAVKIMNSMGFYWCKSANAVNSPKGIHCTDPDVVCPVIDSETHMVTDEVLSGTEIQQYAYEHLDDPYCNFLLDYGAENSDGLTTDDYRETFDPEPSTVEPVEEIDLNVPTVASTGGNTLWLMSEEKLEELFLFLWDPDGTIFDDIVKGAALFGENPMDSIVSLKLFPFDISQVTTSAYRTMHFGRSPVQGLNTRALTSSNLVVFDMGSFRFNDIGMFKDFRDYEPYSDYSLYIPFCGVVPLQAVECIDTEISIKMIVDLIVGSATAVIFTNGVPYTYIDGNIGIDLPVTGRNCAELARTVLAGALAGGAILGHSPIGSIGGEVMTRSADQGMANIRQGAQNVGLGLHNYAGEMGLWGPKAQAAIPAGTGSSLVGFGAAGFAAGAAGIAIAGAIGAAPFIAGAAAAALTHNAPPQTAGCNAPATGLAKPLYPYFIVRRSDSWLPENYTKLYGRPLQQGGKVSDFLGFCTFGNINTDGLTDMTYEEKVQISELLQKGVII